jgi:hypothetical protein
MIHLSVVLYILGDFASLLTIFGGSSFLEVQDHDVSVNDFDVLSDVYGSKRVVTSNHDTL